MSSALRNSRFVTISRPDFKDKKIIIAKAINKLICIMKV